ncbi:MAG TPA: sulfurtransferase TusA family protein [bacterium]
MSVLVDITRDACPMTTAKVGMALAGLGSTGTLEIRLTQGALTNVIAAVKAQGHRVAAVGRDGGHFVLQVTAGGGGGAAAPAAGCG